MYKFENSGSTQVSFVPEAILFQFRVVGKNETLFASFYTATVHATRFFTFAFAFAKLESAGIPTNAEFQGTGARRPQIRSVRTF